MTVEERLARIEAKLDALLEALEGEEAEVETVDVVTMDGQRMAVPAGGSHL